MPFGADRGETLGEPFAVGNRNHAMGHEPDRDVAVTRCPALSAPFVRTSWTTTVPTPPATPDTATVSPLPRFILEMHDHADSNAAVEDRLAPHGHGAAVRQNDVADVGRRAAMTSSA